MTDYGQTLQFGLSVSPAADEAEQTAALVALADAAGLDLIAIQDHPYQPRFLDTWSLIAFLAARTEQIRFFPDVANLALRPPAMLAKAAASLDRLTGGRIELGLGSGGFGDAAAAMGGPQRSPAEAVAATEEALQVIRLLTEQDRPLTFAGAYYQLHRHRPGPAPAHPLGLWLGVYQPRMLRLTGRLADGWVCPLNLYVPPERVPEAQATIDRAAEGAGRPPSAIRRIYNVVGAIGGPAGGRGGLAGSAADWAATLARWATELGFDTFIFWPSSADTAQVERFAREVIPRTRELVAQARSRSN
jgi:alkanesulfonate monooxygenase SsuD/methylene tetrahydromethanopterin reductase-like flavin-dependent oxidoreductase (luciferase family)